MKEELEKEAEQFLNSEVKKMTKVMKYLWRYVRALGFISAVICVILGTDISKLEETTTVEMLLYCALLGTLIIWSAYYTYDFIKTFYKE